MSRIKPCHSESGQRPGESLPWSEAEGNLLSPFARHKEVEIFVLPRTPGATVEERRFSAA
jgi:hypothetical protein